MLSNCLDIISALMNDTNSKNCIKTFVQRFKKDFGVRNVDYFSLSVDGRCLLPFNATVKFEVNDFSHPFSHVIQNAAFKKILFKDLAYWRENKAMGELSRFMTRNDQISIYPLPSQNGAKKISGMLLLIGESQILETLHQEPQFYMLMEIFNKYLSTCNLLMNKSSIQVQLADSLTRLNEETKRQKILADLSKVLIGSSLPMSVLRDNIIKSAQTSLSILIQGQTGTGKEIVAQAIHQTSQRFDKPFVAINCAAIPEHLLESELFGHIKGAFTGADHDKLGLIAAAHTGTLFLDEMGEMPLALQAKLLRVLETKSYRPLGANTEKQSDFRLLAATHVNLRKQVEEGKFRRDLYHRLNQYPIYCPNLNERLGDLRELVPHFIAQYAEQNDKIILGCDETAYQFLGQFHFLGNVRELKNMIDYACVQVMPNHKISACNLQEFASSQGDDQVMSFDFNAMDSDNNQINMQKKSYIQPHQGLKNTLLSIEKKIIHDHLVYCLGNREKTAKILGIPKRTLAHKCQTMGIMYEAEN